MGAEHSRAMPTRKPGKKPAPPTKSTTKPTTAPKKAAVAPARKKPKPAPVVKAKAKPAAKKVVKRSEIDSGGPTSVVALTPKQQRFVDEYLVDLNATKAAERAGYSTESARQTASENLSKPYIQAAIAEARQQQQERTHITADRVVRELALIATADARELVEYVVGCCRHCHGEGFGYQRTAEEFAADQLRLMKENKGPEEFDPKGGIGFNPHRAPHPGCPHCFGKGFGQTFVCDTRRLSPAALALYAGVKQTKEGIEVKMHSKLDAIEKLAKHLGLYEKDNQQRVDPLASLLHAIAGGTSNGFKPVAQDPEHDTGRKDPP